MSAIVGSANRAQMLEPLDCMTTTLPPPPPSPFLQNNLHLFRLPETTYTSPFPEISAVETTPRYSVTDDSTARLGSGNEAARDDTGEDGTSHQRRTGPET